MTATRLWFDSALLRDGWARRVRVLIEGGRISGIERDVSAGSGDERHALGIPGLCNVHSHGFQRALAGLTERAGPVDDDFWTWREVMYRFLDRLDPDAFEAITAFAYLEMLERGFTRVGEFHYVHHDPRGTPYGNVAELAQRVAAAAGESGIGLTLLPVMYAHAGFGGAPALEGQRRFIHDLDGFARLFDGTRAAVATLPHANLGVAPHSLRAVTPAQLGAVVKLAPAGPVHIHAAEQVREVDDCVAWSGQRPVEWLLDHAAVDSRWTLIHATHMNAAECARLAGSGATAGLCPVTEANLGDGIFKAREFLAAGGNFGLGTDSNVNISPSEELRMLEYSQRLNLRARNVLASPRFTSTGRRLFEGALAGGARSLGIGSAGIEVGALADLVTLDTADARLAGLSEDSCLDAWIFGAGHGLVDSVWCQGVRHVERGVHRQRGAIAARYARTLAGLLAR